MNTGLFDLGGKVAIVTGGNGGIGLGMARGLAEAGAGIAIVGRNEAKSVAAVTDLKQPGPTAISITPDGTHKAAGPPMVARLTRELRPVDTLVNHRRLQNPKTPHPP